MPNTDIDGSPILMLGADDCKALCDYFHSGNFVAQFRTLSNIWERAEEIVKYRELLNAKPA